MTMTLDMPADMVEKVNAKAQQVGLTPEEFVLTQIAGILDELSTVRTKPKLSHEEWLAKLDSLGVNLPPGTVINEAAYSRDSMYDDRW